MKFHKNIYKISIVAICAAMLFSCKNDIKNVIKISEIDKLPELSGKEIYFTQSEYGKRSMQVYTPTLQKFSKDDQQKTIFPDGIRVVHFSEYPDTLSLIFADYAVLHEKEEYWEAKGNVIAKNTKGEILNTEYLIWDQKEKKISSDKRVEITTEYDIIVGQGFHSDEHFDNWEIDKVTGIFTFDDDESDIETID